MWQCCCRRRRVSTVSPEMRWHKFVRWVLRLDWKRLMWANHGHLLRLIQEQGEEFRSKVDKKKLRTKPHLN